MLLTCEWLGLSVRNSSRFLLPIFVLAQGKIIKSLIHIKKASTNNILIVFFINKFCVKKMPLVAQILGNGFKEKTRIKTEGCWMMVRE